MRACLVVLGVMVLLGVASTVAGAASDPGWWAGHTSEEQHAIVDFMYESTGHATVPYSGDAATMADAIAQDVADAAAERAPLASEFGLQELLISQRAGLTGALGDLIRAASPVGGVLLARAVFGRGLTRFVMTMQAPDQSLEGGTWSWNEVTWEPYGTEIYYGAKVQQRPGAYVYNAGYGGNTFPIARWFESPCDFSGFTPPTGARLQTRLRTTAECAEFSMVDLEWHLYPIYVDYPYLLETDFKPIGPYVPFDAETYVPDYTIETPPDPGAETVEEALEGFDDDGNELAREMLDYDTTPGAQPEENPIRDGLATEEEDEECRAYFGDAGGGGTDPGARSAEAEEEAADWDFDIESYEEVYNPLTRETQTVKLRWGTTKWGYRHIVIEHGFEFLAAIRTRLAVQTDRSPIQEEREPNSFDYVLPIPGLPNEMRCRQFVVVSYRRDAKVPVGRGIITSFVKAY